LASAAIPPWCLNESAPAVPHMYGDLGHVDLVGPRGEVGQYIDVPAAAAPLFSQGLAQLWGFNNVEALRSFEAAAELVPECALCHWGVAMAFAPNINYILENQTMLNTAANRANQLASQQATLLLLFSQTSVFTPRHTHTYQTPLACHIFDTWLGDGLSAQSSLTNKTRHLIRSISSLVEDPSVPDDPSSKARQRYAQTICTPSDSTHTNDADLSALCAAALMGLSPWSYYEGSASGMPSTLKPELVPAMERLRASVHGGNSGVYCPPLCPRLGIIVTCNMPPGIHNTRCQHGCHRATVCCMSRHGLAARLRNPPAHPPARAHQRSPSQPLAGCLRRPQVMTAVVDVCCAPAPRLPLRGSRRSAQPL
jgi:hypothetical protein